MRQAIGELVTCSRCGGTWAAAGLAVSQILAPRFGRLLTWSLAAAGANSLRASSIATRRVRRRSTSSILSAAAFKASRTLARDEVGSFLREPFVEGQAHEGGEDPVETGDMRQAIGELVTCSRCVGTWAATGLAVSQILAPRAGRLLTWSLAAAGANDWLQAGFTALTAKANDLNATAG